MIKVSLSINWGKVNLLLLLRWDTKDLYDRARWYQFCLPHRTYMTYFPSPGLVFFISNGVTCSLDYYFLNYLAKCDHPPFCVPTVHWTQPKSLHFPLCLLTPCYISASFTIWWMLSEQKLFLTYICIMVIWIWWAFKNVWRINEWRKEQMSSPLQVKYLLAPIKTQFCLVSRLDNRMIQKNIGNYTKVH